MHKVNVIKQSITIGAMALMSAIGLKCYEANVAKLQAAAWLKELRHRIISCGSGLSNWQAQEDGSFYDNWKRDKDKGNKCPLSPGACGHLCITDTRCKKNHNC